MPDSATVPFAELPQLGVTGLRHSWDVFGRGDRLGTLNRLTPDVVQQALRSVRSGARVSLSLPVTLPDPPLFGRQALQHTVVHPAHNTWDDRLDNFYPQASTQWDSLLHISAREDGHYGGWDGDPEVDGLGLGISNWAEQGIIGRGVLIDMAAYTLASESDYDPFVTRRFTPADLEAAIAAQGTALQPGDILCLRTGWVDKYVGLSHDERVALALALSEAPKRTWAGLAADESMSEYLWNAGFSVIAADNPAIEVAPGSREAGSLHRRLIPALGFALGELFDFGALAAQCAASGNYDFLFVSVPLNVPGGVGSPAAAVAVL